MKTGLKLIGYYTSHPANFRDDDDIPKKCPLCGKSRRDGRIMVTAVDEDRKEFDVHLGCFSRRDKT